MELMWWAMSSVVLVLVMMLVVWVTLWFAKNHFDDRSRWENESFRQVEARSESTIERLEKERRVADILPQLVEASNANTKALELLEKTVNQMVLRTLGYQDRAPRQRQVGEVPVESATVGNRTVLTRAPQTRTDEGEEGFVDETSGKVVPLQERTPRDLAATEPT